MPTRTPTIVDYFRHVVLPDEAFIQTILLNNDFKLSPDDLRYYDFTKSRHGHSRVLGPSDLAPALASRSFFARKFDTTITPKILDRLDDNVLG